MRKNWTFQDAVFSNIKTWGHYDKLLETPELTFEIWCSKAFGLRVGGMHFYSYLAEHNLDKQLELKGWCLCS